MPFTSYNLMARKLLENDEFGKINRPYQLILSRKNPAMMASLPLENTLFNKMLGLGDKEHNQKAFIERGGHRPVANITRQGENLWGIWNNYNKPVSEKAVEPTHSRGATSQFYIKNEDETEDDYYSNCATTSEYHQDIDDD